VWERSAHVYVALVFLHIRGLFRPREEDGTDASALPCLRNDLYCVGWGVKLYSLSHSHSRRCPDGICWQRRIASYYSSSSSSPTRCKKNAILHVHAPLVPSVARTHARTPQSRTILPKDKHTSRLRRIRRSNGRRDQACAHVVTYLSTLGAFWGAAKLLLILHGCHVIIGYNAFA